jgi:toxin ParE1/3/4
MTGYRITPTAERDLRGILQYVAEKDGIDRALHLHWKLAEAFELLGASPGAGRVRADLTGPTVRWWTVFKFVIIYEAESSPVEILRVLHGMRDLGAVL